MQSDLEERNIKLSELAYGSDKIHQLFQEMMQLAHSEYAFASENVPLMVEAMRVGVDSIVVIVTKITDMGNLEKKLNLIPQARSVARFKRKELIETPAGAAEDSISIFSFDTFDITADAISRLRGQFDGVSRVYKYDGRYFLYLQNETKDDRNTADLEAILFEYGQKHVSNTISKQYLSERGETLIPDNAVEKLAAYHINT
jgi:adapter protein MecA 1/2